MEDMTFTKEDVLMRSVDSDIITGEFPNGVVVTDSYTAPFDPDPIENYAIAWEAADSVGIAAGHGDWTGWAQGRPAGISPASARALAAALMNAADKVEARLAEAEASS